MVGRYVAGLASAIVAMAACGESESPSRRQEDAHAGEPPAAGASGRSGGPGGQGNAPATGGSSATGGSPNGGTSPGGQSGAGPGGAGDGGAGDAGGSGGTGGEPPDDPDVLARAAVVLGSCYPDDGVSRNAAELWHWRERAPFWSSFRLQAACIAEAGGGCRALETCLGWTLGENASCSPGTRCAGSMYRECIERPGYDNLETTIDCATLEVDCDERSICSAPPPVDCDPEIYAASCEANEPTTCLSSGVVRRGPDCTKLGLTCVADDVQTPGTTIARCTGTGEACTNLSDPLFDGLSCAGSTLDACVNARRHELDCTTLGAGFACQNHSGIPFCGLASECLPAHLQGWAERDVPQAGIPAPTCDGTSIVFCNAGRLESVDCTTLGFTGCDVEAGYGCIPSPRTELTP